MGSEKGAVDNGPNARGTARPREMDAGALREWVRQGSCRGAWERSKGKGKNSSAVSGRNLSAFNMPAKQSETEALPVSQDEHLHLLLSHPAAAWREGLMYPYQSVAQQLSALNL